MPPKRELPEGRNPMLEEDRAPTHEILVERRCLGQTELKVKPGQVGTSNATKPDNLGVLDYAHLRVPLPKDLNNSGIFSKGANRKWPEAYFLMRRSSDGFISATGMFKAAFPWSQQEEETDEKEYIKSLDTTSSEEVAGNVWIHPDQALSLADEYGIRLWIAALLDPEPITHGTSDPKKDIKSPPAFRMKDMINGSGRSPEKKSAGGRRTTRGAGGSLRSESPTKKTPRKIATPRKSRKGGRGGAASVEPEGVNGEDAQLDSVKVEIEEMTTQAGDGDGDETTTTKVRVHMPTDHPDLKLPEDTEGMLEKAREMVAEAEKIAPSGSGSSTMGKGKRKAEDWDGDDARPAKRASTVEMELRKERMKRRALMGIAGSVVVGAIIPAIMTAFGS